jgi:hypothetical protein
MFHRQQFHRRQQPPPEPIRSDTTTITQRSFLTSVLKSQHTWLIQVRINVAAGRLPAPSKHLRDCIKHPPRSGHSRHRLSPLLLSYPSGTAASCRGGRRRG